MNILEYNGQEIKQREDGYDVIKVLQKSNGKKYLLVQCRCGNYREVRSDAIKKSWRCKSCASKNNKHAVKHGYAIKHKKLCSVYINMKNRCYNKANVAYKNYGGRGITICKEWLDNPTLFYDWALSKGYHKNLQIDRVDNNKGYTPDNCRFITPEANCSNKRSNRLCKLNGETMTFTQASRMLGFNISYLSTLVRRGRQLPNNIEIIK